MFPGPLFCVGPLPAGRPRPARVASLYDLRPPRQCPDRCARAGGIDTTERSRPIGGSPCDMESYGSGTISHAVAHSARPPGRRLPPDVPPSCALRQGGHRVDARTSRPLWRPRRPAAWASGPDWFASGCAWLAVQIRETLAAARPRDRLLPRALPLKILTKLSTPSAAACSRGGCRVPSRRALARPRGLAACAARSAWVVPMQPRGWPRAGRALRPTGSVRLPPAGCLPSAGCLPPAGSALLRARRRALPFTARGRPFAVSKSFRTGFA